MLICYRSSNYAVDGSKIISEQAPTNHAVNASELSPEFALDPLELFKEPGISGVSNNFTLINSRRTLLVDDYFS